MALLPAGARDGGRLDATTESAVLGHWSCLVSSLERDGAPSSLGSCPSGSWEASSCEFTTVEVEVEVEGTSSPPVGGEGVSTPTSSGT